MTIEAGGIKLRQVSQKEVQKKVCADMIHQRQFSTQSYDQ